MPITKPALRKDLDRAGYYPELVADVVDVSLAGEPVVSHYVHLETTFASAEVRRHLTVLALTPTRLIITHVDDQMPGEDGEPSHALATTEAVPIGAIAVVALTHEFAVPEQHRAGSAPTTLVLAISWGSVQRLDLEPAQCSDPQCEADHGYTGSTTPDDLVVRISGEAEGPQAVRAAVAFARALSAATAGA